MEMILNGLLVIETEYVSTKSEAQYVYLLVSTDTRYRLYRPEMSDANDDFFLDYANHQVEVVGNVEERDDMDYMAVTSINIKEYSEVDIERNSDEKVLQ